MLKTVTIALSGEQGAGKTLLAAALAKLLTNRGFTISGTDRGDGPPESFDVLELELGDEDRGRLVEYGRTLAKVPKLDHETRDIHSGKPDRKLLGQIIHHTGNGKAYVIEDFAWMGEDDEWGFVHRRLDDVLSVPIVRPMAHLLGRRADNAPRYQFEPSAERQVREGLTTGRPDWSRERAFGGKLTDNLAQSRNAADDYVSHHHDFRAACVIARDSFPLGDEANRSYWQHQIDTLDRIEATPPKPKTPADDWRAKQDRMEAGDFVPGDEVQKFTGDYQLPGVVVAVFGTRAGQRRYVVEHPHGVLHIYGPNNLRPLPSDGLTVDQRDDKGWMIVGTDNFARETVEEFVIARNVRSKEFAERMAQALNGRDRPAEIWYVTREQGAKVGGGMADLV